MCRGWKLLLMSCLPLKDSAPLKLQPECCKPEGTKVHEESFSPTKVPFHFKGELQSKNENPVLCHFGAECSLQPG